MESITTGMREEKKEIITRSIELYYYNFYTWNYEISR